MRNILCNICQPVPILIAEVWRQNSDYAKSLQAKYFTSENIPIYGSWNLWQEIKFGSLVVYLYKCQIKN